MADTGEYEHGFGQREHEDKAKIRTEADIFLLSLMQELFT